MTARYEEQKRKEPDYGSGLPLVRAAAMLTVPEEAQPISARIIVR
jgi:hypothetical protein